MATKPQNDPRRRVPADVQAHQRDKFVREHNAKMRAESNAKTAKLRALRLAKEAADKKEQGDEEKSLRQTAAAPRTKRVFRH